MLVFTFHFPHHANTNFIVNKSSARFFFLFFCKRWSESCATRILHQSSCSSKQTSLNSCEPEVRGDLDLPAVLTINCYISSAVRFATLILRCKKVKKNNTEWVNAASSVIENNYSASARTALFLLVADFKTLWFDPILVEINPKNLLNCQHTKQPLGTVINI